jgi:hypothetical protein
MGSSPSRSAWKRLRPPEDETFAGSCGWHTSDAEGDPSLVCCVAGAYSR